MQINMLKSILFIVLSFFILTSYRQINPDNGSTFYIATNGNDTNPGTKDAPFLTLERARKAIRELKEKHDKAPVTIYLREGTYPIHQTVVFGPDDVFADTAPITFRSFPGEKAILSGGKPITNWRK